MLQIFWILEMKETPILFFLEKKLKITKTLVPFFFGIISGLNRTSAFGFVKNFKELTVFMK